MQNKIANGIFIFAKRNDILQNKKEWEIKGNEFRCKYVQIYNYYLALGPVLYFFVVIN